MAEHACELETSRLCVATFVACDDETELVERAKTEPQAFGQLYELYYSRILNYIYRRTLDVALAEELTSNTFFNALRALPGYDNRGKFGAWLYRIAGNEIRLNWRAKRNRRESDSDGGKSSAACVSPRIRRSCRRHRGEDAAVRPAPRRAEPPAGAVSDRIGAAVFRGHVVRRGCRRAGEEDWDREVADSSGAGTAEASV